MNKHRQHRHHYKNGGVQTQTEKSYNHVIQDPQAYMFTQKNILLFTKLSTLSTFEKGGAKRFKESHQHYQYLPM